MTNLPTAHAATRVGIGWHLANTINAELALIQVRRDLRGRPTELGVQTGTHSDPVIFSPPAHEPEPHTGKGKAGPHEAAFRPHGREVQWVTLDLLEGERLVIAPKHHQYPHFRWDSFELDHSHFAVASGAALMNPDGDPHRQEWRYNLVLHSPVLREPLLLDPVIIIVDEP